MSEARSGIQIRSIASFLIAVIVLYTGYRFFVYSLGYLAAEPPRVTAGLMAALAGFTFTAAGVTLLRDWVIVERACRLEESKERK